MRNWIVLMMLVLAGNLPARGQGTNDVDLCKAATNADAAVIHCTAAINSGRLSEESYNDVQILIDTFTYRALAYHSKGQYDLAIQDFSQVLRLNPDSAEAF